MRKPSDDPSATSPGSSAGAARRLSTASTASSSTTDAAVPRYSWHGDETKTRVLLQLVDDTVAPKPPHQRRVTASEWAVILDAFNRSVAPPAESARVLHNRFSNLRVQCKEYHQVVVAQRRGLLGSVDAWVAFLKVNPALRKWRKKPFAFYDAMVQSLRLQGEDLDNPHDDENGDRDDDSGDHGDDDDSARQAVVARPKPAAKRRRTQATTTLPATRAMAANAPGGVVSISHYPAALRHLAALALPLEDRVDAKRFLVEDGNAQAFIYMDENERRFFLRKYCFDRRDAGGRISGVSTSHGSDDGGDGEEEGGGDPADASPPAQS